MRSLEKAKIASEKNCLLSLLRKRFLPAWDAAQRGSRREGGGCEQCLGVRRVRRVRDNLSLILVRAVMLILVIPSHIRAV